jgi:hypothetical protein
LGSHGGAGHLIICEVLRMHIDDRIIDENGRIDPDKIDLMGRMGRAYYVRASGGAIETYFQPFDAQAIGFDALPIQIRHSKWLSGNEIAEIASITEIPELDFGKSDSLSIFTEEQLHLQVKEMLALSKKEEAAGLIFNYYHRE